MALTEVDRKLLDRCLNRESGAWNDFVDRYLGLIYHVVYYTAHLRSHPLNSEDVEDVAAEVLLQIVANNYAVLRQFRRESSLASYLTVITRRICVHELGKRYSQIPHREFATKSHPRTVDREPEDRGAPRIGLEGLEEVQKILRKLPARERDVVRLFYLEGRTYEEISTRLNIPVNTIGPILSRARKKLRQQAEVQASPKRGTSASKGTTTLPENGNAPTRPEEKTHSDKPSGTPPTQDNH